MASRPCPKASPSYLRLLGESQGAADVATAAPPRGHAAAKLEPVVDPQQTGFGNHTLPGRKGRVRTELHQPGRPGSRASCTHPAATRPQDCPAAPKRSPLPPPAGSSPRVESNDSVDRPRVGPGEALPGSRLPSSAGAYWPPAVFAPKVRAPRGRLPSGLVEPPPRCQSPVCCAIRPPRRPNGIPGFCTRAPYAESRMQLAAYVTLREGGDGLCVPTPPVALLAWRRPTPCSPNPAG